MKQHPTRFTMLKKTTVATLTAVLIGLPSIALADPTHCEQGRISYLQLQGGSDSEIFIATENSPAADYVRAVAANGKRATRIWYVNGTRWRDRISLLRTAFALQLPVKLVSRDDNCIGNDDEFTISVCSASGC